MAEEHDEEAAAVLHVAKGFPDQVKETAARLDFKLQAQLVFHIGELGLDVRMVCWKTSELDQSRQRFCALVLRKEETWRLRSEGAPDEPDHCRIDSHRQHPR